MLLCLPYKNRQICINKKARMHPVNNTTMDVAEYNK